MDWIRTHLKTVYGLTLGLIVITGAVLVSNKFATTSGGDSYTWGSYGDTGRFIPSDQYTGSTPLNTNSGEIFTVAEISQKLQNSPDRVYASLGPKGSNPTSATITDKPDEAIEALLKSIAPSKFVGNMTSGEKSLDEVYHFIPKNILTLAPQSAQKLTDAQQGLYTYGNEAGSIVENYDSQWGATQANIHRSYVEDRESIEKAAELARLAKGLADVAGSLSAIEFVPTGMTLRHKDLIAAYTAVGEQTLAISKARTDDELLPAIENYNASAEQFLRSYLAISTIFTLNSVSFGTTDPGRVFVYSERQQL